MKEILIGIVTVLVLLTLFTLAAPEPAQRARQALDRFGTGFWNTLGALLSGLGKSLGDALRSENLWACVKELGRRWLSQLSDIRQGYTQTVGFFWSLLVGILLLLPFWFSLYVDSRAIELGLEVVFGSEEAEESSLIGEIFDPLEKAAQSPAPPQESWMAQVARFLISPFLIIWKRELGPMAIGLAALQGALGLFMFWRMGAEALQIKPAVLLKERLIPFVVFLLIEVTLAVLAGIRGFKITDDSWTGAFLAGGLGLIMPRTIFFFSVWVFCIDISGSLRPEEFDTLKGFVQALIQEDVRHQDTVWLIPIGTGVASSSPIKMPPPPRRPIPAEIHEAESNLKRAKDDLLEKVNNLRYGAEKETNLYDPIEQALSILQEQRAEEKVLVIGSDFIHHVHGGKMTIEPRNPPEGLAANDAKVLLVFGYPKDEYLKKLRMTGQELYGKIKQKWESYFKNLGAEMRTRQGVSGP